MKHIKKFYILYVCALLLGFNKSLSLRSFYHSNYWAFKKNNEYNLKNTTIYNWKVFFFNFHKYGISQFYRFAQSVIDVYYKKQ